MIARGVRCSVKKGNPIWYVDFELGIIENGEVVNVHYKDGCINSFSVNFEETGDFDEFIGNAIGENFFTSEEMAKTALANKCGLNK